MCLANSRYLDFKSLFFGIVPALYPNRSRQVSLSPLSPPESAQSRRTEVACPTCPTCPGGGLLPQGREHAAWQMRHGFLKIMVGKLWPAIVVSWSMLNFTQETCPEFVDVALFATLRIGQLLLWDMAKILWFSMAISLKPAADRKLRMHAYHSPLESHNKIEKENPNRIVSDKLRFELYYMFLGYYRGWQWYVRWGTTAPLVGKQVFHEKKKVNIKWMSMTPLELLV